MDLIDNYFQMDALQNGKSVKGFETVDFQMRILFGTPLEKQAEHLMCMVDHFQDIEEMSHRVTEAYFLQDLNKIEEVMEAETENDCSDLPEDNDVLVYGRNRNWVEMMPEMMAEQPTLFVVGAAHLCGEQGVLRLLEEAGYTVEGVK